MVRQIFESCEDLETRWRLPLALGGFCHFVSVSLGESNEWGGVDERGSLSQVTVFKLDDHIHFVNKYIN